MNILSLPLSDLRRRPLRSMLTVFGICSAVACFFTLVSMSRGLERGWVGSLNERDIHLLALSRDAVEVMSASLPQDIGRQISMVDGVTAAVGELANLIRVEGKAGHIMVRGLPYDSFLWRGLHLRVGHTPGKDQPNGAVVGNTLAALLDLKVGGAITLRNREFVITGITAPSGAWNDGTVFLLLPALQTLLDREGHVMEFCLQVRSPNDAEFLRDLKQRLGQQFPQLVFLESGEIGANNDVLKMFRAFTWAVSTVAMVMALVIILNTLLMSVTERTREIGILSAVGWNPVRILFMIVLQGLILAVIGTVLGLVLGVAALKAFLTDPTLRGIIEPGISLRIVVEALVAAVLLGGVGGLYPAWRAARAHPVESLRYG